LGYLDFLGLMDGARAVLTDSGGIQEETTVLGVPCLTLRETTERPITLREGTNRLVGSDPARLLAAVRALLREKPPARAPRILLAPRPPRLWDGRAGERIAEVLLRRTPGAGRAGETGGRR
jgi:UDP-N-acetylglucosamine 2-epimerase (non-hydrolysing)